MPRILLGTFVALCLIMSLGSLGLAQDTGARKVGGPCAYKTYSGRALIGEITALPDTGKYKVMFDFTPDEPIREEFASPARPRRFSAGLTGDPDADYLARSGLKSGQNLRCDLLVIQKGTCTPLIFKFPELPEK